MDHEDMHDEDGIKANEDRIFDAYNDYEKMEEDEELDPWAAGVMRGYASA